MQIYGCVHTLRMRSVSFVAGEFALQPEPSLILSQLVQRHAGPSLPLARQPSPPSQQQAPPTPAPLAPQLTSTSGQAGSVMAAGAKPSAPSTGLDPQGGSMPQQQRGALKGQKRRIPPASKAGHHITVIAVLSFANFRVQSINLCSRTLSDSLHGSRDARVS